LTTVVGSIFGKKGTDMLNKVETLTSDPNSMLPASMQNLLKKAGIDPNEIVKQLESSASIKIQKKLGLVKPDKPDKQDEQDEQDEEDEEKGIANENVVSIPLIDESIIVESKEELPDVEEKTNSFKRSENPPTAVSPVTTVSPKTPNSNVQPQKNNNKQQPKIENKESTTTVQQPKNNNKEQPKIVNKESTAVQSPKNNNKQQPKIENKESTTTVQSPKNNNKESNSNNKQQPKIENKESNSNVQLPKNNNKQSNSNNKQQPKIENTQSIVTESKVKLEINADELAEIKEMLAKYNKNFKLIH